MDAVVITLVGTLALFIAGLPLARLAYPADDSPGRWGAPTALVVAPVLGYGVITLVLRTTAAAGLGVQKVAWPIAALFLLAFLVVERRRGLRQLGAQVRASAAVWVCFGLIVVLVGASYARVGASAYRGYAWWDTIYYAAQAEALRVASPNEFREAFGAQPFTSVVTNFEGGPERFSRGLLQAFVAALCGTDGASTVGFVGVVAVALTFVALLFLMRDVRMAPPLRLVACASAALTPCVVIGQLEGFLPLTLLTGSALVVIRLWVDLAEEFNLWRMAAAAALLAASLFTLMESLYVMAAVTVVVAVSAALLIPSPTRGVLAVIGTWPLAAVLCLPLGDRLLSEIIHVRELMTRTSLNLLYPFADTPRVLTWSLWGTQLEARSDHVAIAATAVATVLVLLGGYGVLTLLLDQLSLVGVALSAYMILPLYFVFSGEDLRYSLFKMLSLVFPVVWFGTWLAATDFAAKARAKLVLHRPRLVASAVSATIVGVVAVASVLAVGASARKVWAVSTTSPETASTRLGYWRSFAQPGVLEELEQYDTWSGESVVLVHPHGDQRFWMSAYSLRRNDVWSLGASADDLYSAGAITPPPITTVPLSARMAFAADYQDWDLGRSAREDFAVIIEGELGGVFTPFDVPNQTQAVDSISVRAFSRERTRLDLVIESRNLSAVTGRGPTGRFTLVPGRNVIRLPISAGGQQVDLRLQTPPEGVPVSVSGATLGR